MELQKKKLILSDIKISFTERMIDLLATHSYEPQYGARPVKRAINDLIINPLTMKLLSRDIDKGKEIVIDANESEFIFTNMEGC